eukprot:evm.model.scf_508.2 EVM.evm.TU.scf_508.2   scf_508:37101-43383(-)
MAEGAEPECWEDLDQLTLSEAEAEVEIGGRVRPGAEKTGSSNGEAAGVREPACGSEERFEDGGSEQARFAGPTEARDVDRAIAEALSNPRERATALRIDAEVEQFVADGSRMVMEFSQDMTGYQRLLAHRISQHYGLQTSSIPGTGNLTCVVARRCSQTCIPKMKIAELKDIHCPQEAAKAAPEVTIKRRIGGAASRVSTLHSADGVGTCSSQIRSVKEREQEYKAARERILGRSSDSDVASSSCTGSQKGNGEDKGQWTVDDAKSKAVFRNRAREMEDPDYRRGANRFHRSFDPNQANNIDRENAQGMYNVPSYNTEFPILPRVTPTHANVAMLPFYPRSMGPWGQHSGMTAHAVPAQPPSLGSHEQVFQQQSAAPSLQPYTVPPHPYNMPFGYTPDMIAGPSPADMYPPSAGAQHVAYQPMAMGQYTGVQGYKIASMPGQDGVGMVPYPMYGSYPHQPGRYPEYGDVHRYHGHSVGSGLATGGHHEMGAVAGGAEQGRAGGHRARRGGGRMTPRLEPGPPAKVENSSKAQAVEN